MKSMTGYGQASGVGTTHRTSATVRTVNGRFLDCSIRLQEDHRHLEAFLRQLVERRLSRGRVDLTVEIRALEALPARVEIQARVVEALSTVSKEMATKGLVADELGLADLLRLPGVVEIRVEDDVLSADDRELVARVVDQALDEVAAARTKEGEQLATILAGQLAELRRAVGALTTRVGVVRESLHDTLRLRVQDLIGDRELDAGRLAQEVAVLVDRADVTEELDRLSAHLDHFEEVVSTTGPIGKRLDFLTQELLRELNTLGAKGRDAEITRLVLDGKVVCERLREQLQNVE